MVFDDFYNIIGWASFIQNSKELSKWFYTDLWVAPEYRRMGIATKLVKSGLRYLSEYNAEILCCTVDKSNKASLNLQCDIGFEKVKTEPFEDFDTGDGLTMFKISVSRNYNIVPLSDDYNQLLLVCSLLSEPEYIMKINEAVDSRQIYSEIREALILNRNDKEASYIIRKGVVPVAWLVLSGLDNEDSIWISKLIVHPKYRKKGIGKFAMRFVEEYASSNRRINIYIDIPTDNKIALNLYKSAGYKILSTEKYLNEDGNEISICTLQKRI